MCTSGERYVHKISSCVDAVRRVRETSRSSVATSAGCTSARTNPSGHCWLSWTSVSAISRNLRPRVAPAMPGLRVANWASSGKTGICANHSGAVWRITSITCVRTSVCGLLLLRRSSASSSGKYPSISVGLPMPASPVIKTSSASRPTNKNRVWREGLLRTTNKTRSDPAGLDTSLSWV